jgi:hypothetical protein
VDRRRALIGLFRDRPAADPKVSPPHTQLLQHFENLGFLLIFVDFSPKSPTSYRPLNDLTSPYVLPNLFFNKTNFFQI